MLSSRRGAFKALAHHVGRAGEEPVRVRIVRRPQDLLRADKVREYSEAGFDRLERNPAIALEEFARPRLQAGIVEKLIIEMAVSDRPSGQSGQAESTVRCELSAASTEKAFHS